MPENDLWLLFLVEKLKYVDICIKVIIIFCRKATQRRVVILTTKNIYFYKMDIYKESLQKDNNTYKQEFHNERKIYDVLNNIRNNKTKTKTLNNSFALEKGSNQVTFDFINFDDKYVFARLGRINDKNAIQIRNKLTYVPKGINTGANEDIEIYTYFLLDFNTGIISFISSMYAPSINKLRRLDDIYDLNNYKFNVYPIVNKEAIAEVMKKEFITKFDIDVAVPTDEVLNLEGIGLSMKEFINVKDLKYQRVTITMKTVKPDGNVFTNSKIIKKFVDKVSNSELNIMSMTANAKNDNEKTIPYNLIEHKLIEKKDFDSTAKTPSKYEKEVLLHLSKAYNENKEHLKRYCKITNQKVDD